MFIKFIAGDDLDKQLVVECRSYSVQSHHKIDGAKLVLVNFVNENSAPEGEPMTEFLLMQEDRHYKTAFVMNDRGETIDRIRSHGPSEGPEIQPSSPA